MMASLSQSATEAALKGSKSMARRKRRNHSPTFQAQVALAATKRDRKHMEYVNQHGTFSDVPFDEITATLRKSSPGLMLDDPWGEDADFAPEPNR